MTVKRTLAQNPIRAARVELGYKLNKFAELCGVHEQALYLNECGVYIDILPAVLEVFVKHGYLQVTLRTEYREFQKERRAEFALEYNFQDPNIIGPIMLSKAPIVTFRTNLGLSRQAFAKRLLVQPAILYKLEHGQARHLPQQLVDALEEAGMSSDIIDELNERTEDFYFRHGQRAG